MPKQINYPTLPLQQILTNASQTHPKRTAIAHAEQNITYMQLETLSNQFANALTNLNVKKGDRVAVFLPNIPEFIIAFFGILKAGAVVSTISSLHKEREVEHQLADSGAQTIVTLDTLHPLVEKVKDKTQLKHTITTGPNQQTPIPNTSKHLIFDQLIQNSPNTTLKIKIDPNQDLAALQYTGGTTGTSKGAMLTHKNLFSNALAFATWIRSTETQDTFLTALPLFHIYGMTTSMTTPITQAAKMVLTPKFEPTKILETIQKHKVTVFCGVPTMYSALLAHPKLPEYNLTSIRVCISGASPLPPQVQKHFMKITGGILAEGYGLTEASPVTHCTPVDKNKKTIKIGSIGQPLPDTDAQIIDIQTKTPLKQGETGELAVKGPQIMKGYWKNPQETKHVLKDGWLLTGDIAHMDNQGYFYITDRKKDLIKYKDYSVYPREIEDILYEHPKIKLCAVIGKPDAFVGEIPKAYIVLKDGAEVTEKQIMDFVNQKLAPYKAIREIEFRKELPLSAAGKVLKRLLKENL
jgi:long-chain acyl-CoA synthetase